MLHIRTCLVENAIFVTISIVEFGFNFNFLLFMRAWSQWNSQFPKQGLLKKGNTWYFG